jgi:hypothetical protein
MSPDDPVYSEDLPHTLTVGELRKVLEGKPDDMPCIMRIRVRDDEHLELEDGDDLMGDLRTAEVSYGCTDTPAMMLEGDRDPSDFKDEDE